MTDPCVLFLRTIFKLPFLQVTSCQLNFQMAPYVSIHFFQSIKELHFCLQMTKVGLWLFVSLSCTLLWLSSLWAPPVPLHSLLCRPMPPVVVETSAVCILSGVGYYLWPCFVSRLWTKRLIKTSISATNTPSLGSILHLLNPSVRASASSAGLVIIQLQGYFLFFQTHSLGGDPDFCVEEETFRLSA